MPISVAGGRWAFINLQHRAMADTGGQMQVFLRYQWAYQRDMELAALARIEVRRT